MEYPYRKIHIIYAATYTYGLWYIVEIAESYSLISEL